MSGFRIDPAATPVCRRGRIARPTAAAAALLALLLASAGCTVNQQLTLRVDRSGDAQIHVKLEAVFVDYLDTLSEAAGDSEMVPESVFDTEEVERSVGERRGVTVTHIATPAPEELELSLSFEDLKAMLAYNAPLPGPASRPLIAFSGGDPNTLRVHLARDNYRALTALFPILDHPLLVSLGPQQDLEVTDAEYLEMMGFVLGDDGPPAIEDSTVTVRVEVDGRIIEHDGGELQEDGSLLITIPLIRVLVLDRPLDFTIVYE
ncbi:MAG: hypothetical protein OXJ62_10925 [Spirochaetaceae bacterium]|nr:hypothetical protein [Spirochaetaceae bacterium]